MQTYSCRVNKFPVVQQLHHERLWINNIFSHNWKPFAIFFNNFHSIHWYTAAHTTVSRFKNECISLFGIPKLSESYPMMQKWWTIHWESKHTELPVDVRMEQALHRTGSICPLRVRRHLHNMSHAFPSCTYHVRVSLKSHDGIIICLPLPQSHCFVCRCRENQKKNNSSSPTWISLRSHITYTNLDCPIKVFTQFPCVVSHTFTPLSSYPPETMNIPFLENSQHFTWNDWDLILWIHLFLECTCTNLWTESFRMIINHFSLVIRNNAKWSTTVENFSTLKIHFVKCFQFHTAVLSFMVLISFLDSASHTLIVLSSEPLSIWWEWTRKHDFVILIINVQHKCESWRCGCIVQYHSPKVLLFYHKMKKPSSDHQERIYNWLSETNVRPEVCNSISCHIICLPTFTLYHDS